MNEGIKNFVKITLAENSELNLSELTDELVIKESIDSLEWLDFMHEINLRYQIKIPIEDTPRHITIKQLCTLIEKSTTNKLN